VIAAAVIVLMVSGFVGLGSRSSLPLSVTEQAKGTAMTAGSGVPNFPSEFELFEIDKGLPDVYRWLSEVARTRETGVSHVGLSYPFRPDPRTGRATVISQCAGTPSAKVGMVQSLMLMGLIDITFEELDELPVDELPAIPAPAGSATLKVDDMAVHFDYWVGENSWMAHSTVGRTDIKLFGSQNIPLNTLTLRRMYDFKNYEWPDNLPDPP
jgi:hypothetical protein